jgi:hypothetical protein
VDNAPCSEGTTFDTTTQTCVAVCGEGTTLQAGECYPLPGICSDGTMFQNGECVPDIAGCAAGTVLVDGQCVPAGEDIPVDVEESPEPNFPDGDNVPAVFAGPAVGDSVVLHGCLPAEDNTNPNIPGFGDVRPDFDWFVFNTTGPAYYEVTVDGVNGAAGAFAASNDPGVMFSYIFGGSTYTQENYVRLGLSLTGDTSKREMVIPAAGTHHLVITDTRTLWGILDDGGFQLPHFGTEDECYFVTVTNKGLPTAGTAVAAGEVIDDATMGNTVQFYQYSGTDGDLITDSYAVAGGTFAQSAVSTLEGGAQ